MGKAPTNYLISMIMHFMAALLNNVPSLNKELCSRIGWINFTVGLKTENKRVELAVSVKDGKVKVLNQIPDDVDSTVIFKDEKIANSAMRLSPSELMIQLMQNKIRIEGNMSYNLLFNFYQSLIVSKKHIKTMEKQKKIKEKNRRAESKKLNQNKSSQLLSRKDNLMASSKKDPGVKYLTDQYLSKYSLKDFPRLKDFLDIHFNETPEICPERAKLMTDWFMENGFEEDKEGRPWVPELRQANALKYLMENRKPIIRKNDLIAGTTTSKEIGIIIYPEAHGVAIWPELNTVPHRELFPYNISDETIKTLHHDVLPFWINRNFREWVRKKYNNPLCQQLDERFAVYFLWKTVALSHTIVDFPKILKLGASGIIREIKKEITKSKEKQKKDTLKAMIITLEGLISYSKNLSLIAKIEADKEAEPVRRQELKNLSRICSNVPENPSKTLHEAVNAIWITWVMLHMENTNAGLSLGRLDQWLQPFFEADMKKIKTKDKREDYIKESIELIGCFYMRCTDHLPLIPDIGNYLFGGSSSDQAITLGGVTPGGKDAVNDMTYVFLKVTEMLSIRDPNVNARYHPRKNSTSYLKRLCEVNYITASTPSMHNDQAVMKSLEEFHYKKQDLRDWAATGCVEPTLSGKHMGHTNCMMMNMVAALEMALNNGWHPLMDWHVGPETGSIEKGDFKTFEDFFKAFKKQFKFLIDNSIEYNNMLGYAHGYMRPTPFLSSLIDGTIKKGRDVTKGGAKYNSSGAACIGLADVTDSLMVIKKLVYDDKKISLAELKKNVDNNFKDSPSLMALVSNKVPFFGSGNDEAVKMANSIARFAHDEYGSHKNYRGGAYTAGFWSMSNHVAFGTLTGAIPSGRLSGKAFTPGLTPQPRASKNLLDNIRDVARLETKNLNNNIAFNVKIVPGPGESREQVVDNIHNYVKTYFDLGGMQIQLNVVTSDILRDAMVNPELYRNLIVRISGYNAYFVTLNRDMQMELIERAEYGI